MTDGSEAFRKAFKEGDSAAEREQIYESETGNDISGPSDSSSSGGGGGGSSGGSDIGGGGPEGGASARYGQLDTPSGPDDVVDDDLEDGSSPGGDGSGSGSASDGSSSSGSSDPVNPNPQGRDPDFNPEEDTGENYDPVDNSTRVEREQNVAEQVERQTGLERGEDFRVTTGLGTESVQEEALDRDTESPFNRDVRMEQQVQLTEQGRERLQERQEGEEQFGDSPKVGGVKVDERLREAGEWTSENIIDPGASVAGDVANQVSRRGTFGMGGSFAPATVAARGVTELTQSPEERRAIDILTPTQVDEDTTAVGQATEATAKGAGEVLNAPATGAGLIEGGEFVAYGASETAAGRGDKFAKEAGEAAGRAASEAYETAQQKPVETGAMVSGSLALSAGAIGGASAASSRAGRAAAYAVQPGEEIVGAAGARAVPGRAGRALFPDNEPLIMSEEAAIRAGKAAARRGRAAGESGRRVLKGEVELQDLKPEVKLEGSPRQRDLIESGRPGSATESMGGEGQSQGAPGAQSEPLGSDTEDILDAAYAQAEGETAAETAQEDGGAVSAFLADERAQAQLAPETKQKEPQRPAEPEIGPGRKDDILEGSPRDRISEDIFERQREMRRQAQGTFEGETDPLARSRQRVDAGQRSEARTDAEQDTDALTRTEPMIDSQAGQDVVADIREDLDVGVEPELDQPVDTRQDTETELETEQELETELETELEVETEQEVETEAELDFETARELETEPALPDRGNDGRRRARWGGEDWDKTFSYEVASPEELDEISDVSADVENFDQL